MLSFFSLNRISNAHFLFKNTLFVLYLPIFKDEPMSLLLILKKCYCSQRTFFFTEMRLHSSYFRLSYKVLFFKKWLFLLCENWWYFTIDLISQHTIIQKPVVTCLRDSMFGLVHILHYLFYMFLLIKCKKNIRNIIYFWVILVLKWCL